MIELKVSFILHCIYVEVFSNFHLSIVQWRHQHHFFFGGEWGQDIFQRGKIFKKSLVLTTSGGKTLKKLLFLTTLYGKMPNFFMISQKIGQFFLISQKVWGKWGVGVEVARQNFRGTFAPPSHPLVPPLALWDCIHLNLRCIELQQKVTSVTQLCCSYVWMEL